MSCVSSASVTQPDVFLPQLDLALVDAVGLIAQRALHPRKAHAVGRCAQVAVKAVIPPARHCQVKRQNRVRGRKDFEQIASRRRRVGVRQLKGQAIRKNPRSMQQRRVAIADGLLVQLGMQQPPRLMPQAGCEECDRVFKIAALCLKMMRAQIHPLRPHHPRQKFHSDRTIWRTWLLSGSRSYSMPTLRAERRVCPISFNA